MDYSTGTAFAYLFLRLFLGILFLVQGYDKIFNVKVKGVVEALEHPMREHSVGRPILLLGAFVTSYLEFFGGLFLIFGLFTLPVLYLLGIDLLVALIGLSIMRPIFDIQHLFRRAVLLAALLIMPEPWSIYSLDNWFSL
jgi:putative oxidoreductase